MLIVAAFVGVGCFLYGCLTKDNCTWRYLIRPILILHTVLIHPLLYKVCKTWHNKRDKIKEPENNNGYGFESQGIKYEIEE